MENAYFNDFMTQFKQHVANGDQTFVISYELYGPNMQSRWSDQAEQPLEYFLWYLTDQGYNLSLIHI